MSSEQRVPWKESNLALIGSALDHQIKAAAAAAEAQWSDLGEEAGLKVWRIEDFRVVPFLDVGKFYTGDSYVVLHTYQKSDDSEALAYDVHIWIGAQSSQDEYGTAAYKMVEADEVVGGAAIQHREVQGHESALFLSYFDEITYLEGGVDSGFNIVEPSKDQPHLYKIKGTEKALSLTQVPLAKYSLNEGDSFLLFANASSVWVWHGSSANPDEKAKANSLAEKMCTQGTVTTLDQGDDDDAFWAYLGTDGDIAPADNSDETVQAFAPTLYQLPAGDEEPVPVATAEAVKARFGPPQAKIAKSYLDEGNVYLLDAGWELFVWIGAEADRSEKLAALTHAETYARRDPRTMDLPLTIGKSGYESYDFLTYFEG